MPEVHTCLIWNKSGFQGAKTSIPMSVQDCSSLPSPGKFYANTTPRYLEWFKSLDHLLMLIVWDKLLRREDSHPKQWIRSSNYVRHRSHKQETYSGCGEPQWPRSRHIRLLGAGEGHACLSFRTGSSEPTWTPWNVKCDSDREFSEKNRGKSCCKSCKGLFMWNKTRVACLGIGMAWPTSPGIGRRKGSLPAPKLRL